MNDLLQIRPMIQPDVEVVFQALEEHGIGKPLDYIKRCAEQNIRGVIYEDKQVEPGSYVKVGHDLALYLIKEQKDRD
ncbi:hypothetical protein [Candidatus Pristimantibacillus sp. PTI5]|uniref:hypothetical protein n=1 Tax=Candidatus Pristimantibacillus sp. PTI5 TaxID=3400422 RepID=UPI003B0155A5